MKAACRFGITGALGLCRSAGLLAVCLILSCFLDCLYETAGAAALRLQNQDVPGYAEQALFVKGQNLYNQNLYHEAIAVFGEFLKTYPQSQIKDLALLWLGRCHIQVGDLGAAEQTGVRLREIPETQFVSLYEGELRVARQSYVKTATLLPKIESASTRGKSLISESADARRPPAVTNLPKANAERTNPTSRPVGLSESAKAKSAVIVKTPAITQQTKSATVNYAPPKAPSNAGPLVRIRMEQDLRETPVGRATFYRLVVVNEGKAAAKDLNVSELLTGDLQFASSDPAPSRQEPVGRSQRLTFRIAELKAGASRTLRIAVRLRVGAGPEAILKAKHSVTYEDSDKQTYVTN